MEILISTIKSLDFASVILILMIVIAYFLPTIYAWNTEARYSILGLNILIGWTMIGWIILFFGACIIPKNKKFKNKG